jgi:hypothetical protein
MPKKKYIIDSRYAEKIFRAVPADVRKGCAFPLSSPLSLVRLRLTLAA